MTDTQQLIFWIVLLLAINALGIAYNIATRRPLRCGAMIWRVLFCWRERVNGTWFCEKHQNYLNDPEEEKR